jgi:hypothetical protein
VRGLGVLRSCWRCPAVYSSSANNPAAVSGGGKAPGTGTIGHLGSGAFRNRAAELTAVAAANSGPAAEQGPGRASLSRVNDFSPAAFYYRSVHCVRGIHHDR